MLLLPAEAPGQGIPEPWSPLAGPANGDFRSRSSLRRAGGGRAAILPPNPASSPRLAQRSRIQTLISFSGQPNSCNPTASAGGSSGIWAQLQPRVSPSVSVLSIGLSHLAQFSRSAPSRTDAEGHLGSVSSDFGALVSLERCVVPPVQPKGPCPGRWLEPLTLASGYGIL
jgi:hypothetical protein